MRDVTRKLPALEAKILELIDPAPEQRYDCEIDIKLALFSLQVERKDPRSELFTDKMPPLKPTLDVVRGLRIIERALAAGAGDLPCLHVSCRDREQYESLSCREVREQYERDWAEVLACKPGGRTTDFVRARAVHSAYELLRRFGKKPPTMYQGGAWHRLALELYSSHGGKGDVYQALRDYRTRNPYRGPL